MKSNLALAALLVLAACGPQHPSEEDSGSQQGLAAFRSQTHGAALAVKTLTLAKPSGVAAKDLLLVRIATRNATAPSFTAPAGWSQLRASASNPSIKDWIYFKVASASEPASYTFSIGTASSMLGELLAFSGVDPTSPIDTSAGSSNSGTAMGSPALTTTSANAIGVWFGAKVHDSTACPANITSPSGTTERIESCLASSTAGLIAASATRSFGVAGLQTGLSGSSSESAANIGQAVALRAAGTTPPPATQCAVYGTFSSTKQTPFSFGGSGVLEPSGLAASKRNHGMLYTHNEDTKNLILLGSSGVAAQYNIGFPFSIPMDNTVPTDLFDWEDIAVGPCPAGSCVYVSDTGKSSGTFPVGTNRQQFALYRIPEPTYGTTPAGSTLGGLERFPFKYPDGAYDTEAMMVHPVGGVVYVLTKQVGKTRVYKFPLPLQKDVLVTLTFVKEMALQTTSDDNYSRTTGADIHPCADRFLLRTYRRVYEFRAASGQPFETAFSAAPVVLTDPVEGQGESIAYQWDGAAYFTVSETPSSGVWPLHKFSKL